MWRVYNLHHTSVFTYSHANTPLGQSERAYYLSYFIISDDLLVVVDVVFVNILGSFRFEDENEDEDEDEGEDEALCFRHNEIFKLFPLQLGRDDEVDYNNIVTPSLSRI